MAGKITSKTEDIPFRALIEEKLKRLDADNKIANLSSAEIFIRGTEDTPEKEKKLQLIMKRAIELGKEKARLEEALKALSENPHKQ